MVDQRIIEETRLIATAFSQSSFKEIGRGRCGVVFEIEGTPYVVKRSIENPDNLPHVQRKLNLRNDFIMHRKIFDAFSYEGYIAIPWSFHYISKHRGSIWNHGVEQEMALEHPFYDSSNLAASSRVPGLPDYFRNVLINRFCHPDFQHLTWNSGKNRHCLIFPQFGRRKGELGYKGVLNLQDFELCADQIRFFYTPEQRKRLIMRMARALATMHWRAKVDGHGVKFVMGGYPPPVCQGFLYNKPFADLQGKLFSMSLTGTDSQPEPVRQAVSAPVPLPTPAPTPVRDRYSAMYMIGFDQVSPIRHPKDFLKMAVRSFVTERKLFYPRPGWGPRGTRQNLEDWSIFRLAYLQQCRIISREEGNWLCIGLVIAFFDRICEFYARRQERNTAVRVCRRAKTCCSKAFKCQARGIR